MSTHKAIVTDEGVDPWTIIEKLRIQHKEEIHNVWMTLVAELRAALSVRSEAEPVAWTQADAERENVAFAEWFKKQGYPNYPDLYPLTTENAMHSAWQEAAKRMALTSPTERGEVEEYYARGYGLRCAVVGFLNGAFDKDELRRRFLDWQGCDGTRFSMSPADLERGEAEETPAPVQQVVGGQPVGYCVWISPTKLAACAKSAKGSFAVYAAPAAPEMAEGLVIVESPFAGDVEANVAYARAAVRDCLMRGEAPYASHLLYTQPGVLDDGVPEQRTLGIEAGLAWGKAAAKTVVYTDRGISKGMQLGIDRAHALGRPVEYRSLSR